MKGSSDLLLQDLIQIKSMMIRLVLLKFMMMVMQQLKVNKRKDKQR